MVGRLRCAQPLIAATVLGLAACASSSPTLPENLSALRDGLRISTVQSGTGKPVIVFENGLAAKKEVWSAVQSAVSKTHTVFGYDRPGQGASSFSKEPRSGSQIVEDLRELLKNQHLEPPYVLVGHSIGGL
jgi:pimeloyl-ACP methyl ester carboxylesterase